MTGIPTIKPKENGPLFITDTPEVRDADGKPLKSEGRLVLCRCGASANKPFCDGSHRDVGFSSAPDHAAIRNKEVHYQGTVDGTAVTVSYTPVLCSHAGECSRLAGDVFNPNKKPWVQPDGGKMPALLAAMAGCPSGALRISTDSETSGQHLTHGDVSITVERHGPYRVRNVALDGEFNGVGASRAKYVLCRCGQSKNKPFCDGTHHDSKWRDDE